MQKVGIGPVTFVNIKDAIAVGMAQALAAQAMQPQPSLAHTSYKRVQQVEPIISPKTQINEQAVAPATTNETVGAGAMCDPEARTRAGAFIFL
jgi:hypothetical protein